MVARRCLRTCARIRVESHTMRACTRESAGRRRYYGAGQHARVLASVSTINCGAEVTARALAEDAKLFTTHFHRMQQVDNGYQARINLNLIFNNL